MSCGVASRRRRFVVEVVPLSSSLLGIELGNRYRLEEQRAATGVLTTWQAMDETLDRSVCVVTVSGPTVEETIDAARKMSVLTDARLAVVLDVGQHTHDDVEYAYVVYEDVAGSSLADWVARGPVAAEAARAVIGETALGLDRAAQSGLRHARLTARHVMQSAAGDVRVQGTAVEAAALGVRVLDAQQAAQQDARDLVRLLWQALTGHAVSDQVTAQTFVAPSALVGSVPSDLDRLCCEVLTGQATSAISPKDVAEALAPWGRVPVNVVETSLLPPVPAPVVADDGPGDTESGDGESGPGESGAGAAVAGTQDQDSTVDSGRSGAGSKLPVATGAGDDGGVCVPVKETAEDAGDEPAGAGKESGSSGDDAAGGQSGTGNPTAGTGETGKGTTANSRDAAASSAQWAAAGAAAAAAVATPHAPTGQSAPQTVSETAPDSALEEHIAQGDLPVATAAMVSPDTHVSPIWGPPDGEPLFADVSLDAFSGHSWAGREARFFIGTGEHPGFGEPSQAQTPAEERRPFEEAVGTHQFAVKPRSSRSSAASGQVIRLVGLAVVASLAIAMVVLAIDNQVNGTPSSPAATPTQQVPSFPESLSASPENTEQPPAEEPTPTDSPITLTAVAAFDPEGGDGENDAEAKKAIDDSDSTFWPTSTYRSRSFGNLKDGVGVLITVPEGASISEVTIKDRGTGGTVQLRAAKSKSLTGSKVLGSFTPDGKEHTVELSEALETPYLLVWYTELPKATDGEYRGELATVGVR